MKISLTHKEANLLAAILWELGEENSTVLGSGTAPGPLWRLTDRGRDITADIMRKLEDTLDDDNRKTGKDRDLSGSPKGTIQDARWER